MLSRGRWLAAVKETVRVWALARVYINIMNTLIISNVKRRGGRRMFIEFFGLNRKCKGTNFFRKRNFSGRIF